MDWQGRDLRSLQRRRAPRSPCANEACGIALVILFILFAAPASGVVLGSVDGSTNTTPPVADPGFENVGRRGPLTAVYLGDGYVLTANHVGAGAIELGGTPYPAIAGSGVRLENGDGTFADLLIYALAPPHPPLPPLALSTSTPAIGTPLTLIGQGRDRGSPTTWVPVGGGSPIPGYLLETTRSIRWGENGVAAVPAVPVLGTWSIATVFNLTGPALPYEAQAVNGDSGGAAFAFDGVSWELAGILYAAGFYESQPLDLALDGNVSYVADLSVYRDQVEGIIAAPEPRASVQLLAGAIGVAISGLSRRPAAGRGRSRRSGRRLGTRRRFRAPCARRSATSI